MDARRHLLPRTICAFLLALAATACSTADYTKPIDDFAAATSNARTALSDLNAQVTESYRQVLESAIVKNELLVQPRAGECEVGGDRCRLVAIGRDQQEEPYPPEPPLVRMTLLMGLVDSYAANLQALLRADTANQAAAHVNAALGSIQNLATTVSSLQAGDTAAPSDVPQFATPVGSAVSWVIGQYVERVKFKGLQRATEAAKQPIRDAANLFTDVSVFASDIPEIELFDEVTAARRAVRANKSPVTISAYARAASKYDSLLTSSPPDLFQRMADAHDALANSLQGEEVSLATASARIEAFAAEAEKLAKILKDLRALGEDGQEG